MLCNKARGVSTGKPLASMKLQYIVDNVNNVKEC